MEPKKIKSSDLTPRMQNRTTVGTAYFHAVRDNRLKLVAVSYPGEKGKPGRDKTHTYFMHNDEMYFVFGATRIGKETFLVTYSKLK